MWLLLAALSGLFVYATTQRGSNRGRYGHHRHHHHHRPRQLAPGPLTVLSVFVSRGGQPPPLLVMCAIAEAETLGRDDLVVDIVRMFIAPVVYQYDIAMARPANPDAYEPAPPMPPWAVDKAYGPPLGPQPVAATDEEIQAEINADPLRFMENLARGGIPRKKPVIDVDMTDVPSGPPRPPIEINMDARAEVDTDQHGAIQSDTVIAGAVDLSKVESPIQGVNALEWATFCDRLSRESVGYTSSRHVGQYRQRRERLVELGVRPESIIGKESAQHDALGRDLADAYRHIRASGLYVQIARSIAVPGADQPVKLTLSGLLGVVQAAGLDGATGWLEKPGDRKRYPHTTQAFLRTNNLF